MTPAVASTNDRGAQIREGPVGTKHEQNVGSSSNAPQKNGLEACDLLFSSVSWDSTLSPQKCVFLNELMASQINAELIRAHSDSCSIYVHAHKLLSSENEACTILAEQVIMYNMQCGNSLRSMLKSSISWEPFTESSVDAR
ncbi:hypothetical protein P7K49_025043 [Saguinus oedipus]|uniref:Uncharacterized protein n=1 Tax=Saguinus oedipus TaxID=9490 RepID=A0ABQ9UGT2_SAGOE|nr:hypothetical protein P7K49_025043 [Saguinus oedipus]